MLITRLAPLSLLGFTLPAAAQLEGRIVSPEGALEGVVVSARKAGSPVTVSVVSGAEGRFSFPAARLEPRYISVHEAAGQPMRVVLPYFRARKTRW